MKFISQGTYGCVYSSNTRKKKDTNNNNHNEIQTVSKIQMINDDDKETIFGKTIQTIFQYESFFAPILETQPIDIGRIEKKETNKCNIFQLGTKQYVSSKIRYVGKITIDDYILNNTLNYKTQRRTVFETHLHLLKGIQKLLLLQNPIIHNDLKYNNILIDKIYDVPIIIDFGLSFTFTELQETLLQTEKMKSLFFSYKPYLPWNIEFTLLSFIAKNILLNQKKYVNFHIDKIEKHLSLLYKVIHSFVKNNFVFIENDQEKDLFIQKMNHYIQSFRTKTFKDLLQDLLKNWKSWDNYSLAMMFYEIIITNFSKKQDHYIDTYKQLLLNIILNTPDITRSLPMDTHQSILTLCQKNKIRSSLIS